MEGCIWFKLPFQWLALGSKSTPDGNMVAKKGPEAPVLLQGQEEPPLAFHVGSNCCIGEGLERKREMALQHACGKGFNSGDQRHLKNHWKGAKVKEAVADTQEIRKGRNLREPPLITSLPIALK